MAGDCPVAVGSPPGKPGTVARLQFDLLEAAPYAMTSDELFLRVEEMRRGPVTAEVFFAQPRACLRASPLVKSYGYGFHHDGQQRVALVPVESETYVRLLADPSVEKRAGMRSARK